MQNKFKAGVAGALFGAMAATSFAGAAWAGPVGMASPRGVEAPSLTDNVYYRRYYRRYGGYYRRGYDPGAALAVGAAAGLLGAAAAGAYYSQPYYYGYGYPVYGYPAYGYPAYGYPYGYGW
jgi:hypothetical protein